MDTETLRAYDENAESFSTDWLEQPSPQDMYSLLTQHFTPGLTADVGCGAGRDVAWLNNNGFETIGYDASQGLLEQARQHYPALRFEPAVLPELEGIGRHTFQNVLCETVIMHLDADLVGPATRRLLDILGPGGTLFLSWRIAEGTSQRDKYQRLYSWFDESLVLNECQSHTVLLDGVEINESSGKMVHRVIVRKNLF
ncbi:hypothetical protein IAD21_01855 [Abditibacteriota bacterium]|nr:hypothetical protein IAD21_01855 [Abditibacteriota bacterium]